MSRLIFFFNLFTRNPFTKGNGKELHNQAAKREAKAGFFVDYKLVSYFWVKSTLEMSLRRKLRSWFVGKKLIRCEWVSKSFLRFFVDKSIDPLSQISFPLRFITFPPAALSPLQFGKFSKSNKNILWHQSGFDRHFFK